MTLPTPTPPECIRREIDAWPPSGLANDDQIDNLARSIWLALLAEGELLWHGWDGHNDRCESADDTYGLWIPVVPLARHNDSDA